MPSGLKVVVGGGRRITLVALCFIAVFAALLAPTTASLIHGAAHARRIGGGGRFGAVRAVHVTFPGAAPRNPQRHVAAWGAAAGILIRAIGEIVEI